MAPFPLTESLEKSRGGDGPGDSTQTNNPSDLRKPKAPNTHPTGTLPAHSSGSRPSQGHRRGH